GNLLYTSRIQTRAIVIVLIAFGLISIYDNSVSKTQSSFELELLAAVIPFYTSASMLGKYRIREKGVFSFSSSLKWSELVKWHYEKNKFIFKSDKTLISWQLSQNEFAKVQGIIETCAKNDVG
ncbi:MAG: hypothetical protein ACLP05_11590, partial [Candidatus Kryptoniota bacterium]